MTLYNPYDDPDVLNTVQGWRAESSVPFIEEQPLNRPQQPCWCTDFHLEVHLHLTYCPRHGREPDLTLWDGSVDPLQLT